MTADVVALILNEKVENIIVKPTYSLIMLIMRRSEFTFILGNKFKK